MLSIIIGFVVFWIFARKLHLSKSIVPAVAIGLSVFISCVHLTLPPENNLRVALGGSLEPWALLISIFLVVYFYREILKRIRSLSIKNTQEIKSQHSSEISFSDVELDRYSRHMIMREIGGLGQKKLKSASVLVVGAGGLGSPVLQYLSAAGIGTIGIIDDDVVDQSNLQRQVIHNDNSIGLPKVFSAQKAIEDQNPYIKVKPYNRRLSRDIASELLSEYDIIIEGSDNFETRYLVNEVAKSLSKVVVSGALSQWEGQVMVFDHSLNSPCYQCIFPEKPAAGLAPTCAEAGVFSALPGVIGTLMAAEAIKHILDVGNGLNGVMLIYDAMQAETRSIKVNKATNCRICGNGTV